MHFTPHDNVDAETTRLLFRNTGLGQLVSVVNATILILVLGHGHPPSWALAWWALTSSVSLLRYAMARRFRSLGVVDAAVIRRWRGRAIHGARLAGLTWAVGAAAMMVADPGTTRLFVALVAAGMVGGAVPILSAAPAAYRGYALPITAAIVGTALFDSHGVADWALALLAALFGVALLQSARYYYATLERSIRLADRLESSERLFRTLAESTSVAIFTYRDTFEYVNPAGERMSGYSLDELRRMPFADILHPDDRAQALLRGQERIGGEEAFSQYEYRVVTKSGAVRWLLFHGAHVVADGRRLGLGSAFDITERREAEEAIRRLAYYDPLTRLPNRRLLLERLGQSLHSSDRRGDHGALLILDVDQFKSLNDTEGHDVGDSFLVEVARRLSACVRQEDTVARLGGDEYVILLEELGNVADAAALRAELVAEKVRRELALPYRLGLRDGEYHSSVSIGVTLFSGLENPTEVVLKEADLALYQAKDAGRNAVRFFNPAMQARIKSRQAMTAAMRRGIERGDFALHYQPQFDVDGRLIGAEALARWTPPDGAPVAPGDFIALAEDSGLIIPLGRWILDTACAQLGAWGRDPRTRDLQLAVNVSARQFHQDDFVATVLSSIAAHGADPRRLKLELTESIVLGDVDGVVARMRELVGAGVAFALDDFGTGYSSLSYLKRLPLAEVKIDQSFVRDAPGDDNDAAIVRAILAMCGSLGLSVVAEGVETAEQLRFLKDNGCRAFQGYLFGRPQPIEAWDAFLG